jgi:hypothetical protein
MDENDDTFPNHLLISLCHEFSATRVHEQRLSPALIKIKLDVSSPETEDSASRLNICLSKIKHLVDDVLQGSVIMDVSDEWATDRFLDDQGPSGRGSIILCPDFPTDAMLANLLVCKFQTLVGKDLHIHGLEVESSDGRGMKFMLIVGDDPGSELPSGEEWLSPVNYFKKPWWYRDDASTMDVIPNEDFDPMEIPGWAYGLSFLAERHADQSPTDRVVRMEFRPVIIQGGRSDH